MKTKTKHVTNKNSLSKITLDKNKHQHKTWNTYKGPGKIFENLTLKNGTKKYKKNTKQHNKH